MGAEMIKPGLHRLGGAAADVLLYVSASGVVVVDSGRAGSYPALMSEIRRIARSADPPIRALVLTASGAEQVGNVSDFVAAGVPVIVQRQAFSRLAASLNAAGPASATTFVTYDTDYVLRSGEIEIEHVGRGRTGADSVVVFRELRVVAVGELFTAGTPRPDCSTGGSFAGWAAAIDHLLWSEFDVAVPSRGAPIGKSELRAFKEKLEALARAAPAPSDCPPTR